MIWRFLEGRWGMEGKDAPKKETVGFHFHKWGKWYKANAISQERICSICNKRRMRLL